MLYSHLYNVFEYDTLKNMVLHADISLWAHSYHVSCSGHLHFCPMAISIDLSGGTHTLHEWRIQFLVFPSVFLGNWWPIRCWSSKPEVDGLPGVGWERFRAADLMICFITSVWKLVWESFFFPLSVIYSDYAI